MALVRPRPLALVIALVLFLSSVLHGQSAADRTAFTIASPGSVSPVLVSAGNPETVRVVAEAFADDVQRISGQKPEVLTGLPNIVPHELIIAGVLGESPEIDALVRQDRLPGALLIQGKWESAVTAVVSHPIPGVSRALVVAGSDRRGVAFALFTISRQIGVSPWNWWADVPIRKQSNVTISARTVVQSEPSVPYRGIFLNDEDWGLRTWAAKKMDPELHNIGPHTYERIFELLLRLRGNTLWPAMHPGTLAFNAVLENARLADKWGIVMGSSHSEALLRNNVGEWDERRDGPWNYQVNRQAIDAYWEKRLQANGRYENFYTVGMRGVHDTGLEATGSTEVKARLVEEVMQSQRRLLRQYVKPDVSQIPQVIWLYKESLELYRAGMRVPDDVTLGWTDDNYGYLRQLPTEEEQKRSGGSGIYYHVSYWGFPHDYLWLCTTPPALIREEMTKAFDHNARRYWILNVGDIKPAEADIDYFLQLAWDEPHMGTVSQLSFLRKWSAEQFPAAEAYAIADVMQRYYQLNFVRKAEFMGFNGYNDGINRTSFNPLAWGDQNRERDQAWQQLSQQAAEIADHLPAAWRDAYFELVLYPVQAAAEQNHKLLATDRSYLDEARHRPDQAAGQAAEARAAYDHIQEITKQYNELAGGKWNGMMSSAPRGRNVFKMPQTATIADAGKPLPASWAAFEGSAAQLASQGDFTERDATVSINAAHFTHKQDGASAWQVLSELGISGESVLYGAPGLLASEASSTPEKVSSSPWIEYEFVTSTSGPATLSLHLLPTFPVDSQQRLRYAVAVDGKSPLMMDASGSGEWKENSAPTWSANVLRNSAIAEIPLGELTPGRHTIRLIYQDPGVVFEHLVITFPGASPAYPVPPETLSVPSMKQSHIAGTL